MLQQFTWGQFLLASFVLSFLWYCFVLLVCYRKEVLSLLGGGETIERLPHRWEKGVESLEEVADSELDLKDSSLMGKSAIPEGMAVVGMGQLSFVGGDGGSDTDSRYGQVGLVPDVIQELKLIFARLESEAGSKLDFFRMLEKVKEEYGKIGAHPNVGAINEFIASHVPFHLSVEELEDLWY